GTSTKHNPQRIGLSHVMEYEDVIQEQKALKTSQVQEIAKESARKNPYLWSGTDEKSKLPSDSKQCIF
ncbi:19990_t:CDS:2, partial [Racocetra persica]